MIKKMKQIKDELVTYNNSLREAEEELNKLYKQTDANPIRIKELKERVNYLSEIVQSFCLKEYDELFPPREIETVSISSVPEFVEALV